MVTVHALRILADLSFYYAFASFAAVCFGSRYAMAGLLLQTACFTLSAALSERKGLRLAALAPMALFWLLPGVALADSVLFLPAAVFLVWQAWRGEYPLVWSRHVELFSAFWKFYTGFAALLLLAGMGPELTAASIPIGLIMLVTSVLLMRTLRHDPETYRQRRYQLMNLLSVLAVVVMAALISTEAFLNTCAAVFRALYDTLVLPVLLVGLWCLVGVLRALAWLAELLNFQLPQSGENPKVNLESAAELLDIEKLAEAGNPMINVIMTVLLAAAAAVALYFFFRWMLSRGRRSAAAAGVREERRAVMEDVLKKPPRQWMGTPVQRVRGQYRRFLKLYESAGGEMEAGDTSLDVDRGARKRRFDPAASAELRDIYIRARYGGQAERQDAARARELYTALKKERE